MGPWSRSRRALVLTASAAVLLTACGGGTAGAPPTSPSPSPSSATSPAAVPTVAAPSGMQTYTNAEYAFSIAYPTAWKASEGQSGSIVAFLTPLTGASDTFRENLNVVEENVPAGTTLAQYTAGGLGYLRRQMKAFTLISSVTSTLGDRPGQRIEYTAAPSGVSLRFLQVFGIVGTKSFVVTFTAQPSTFASYLPKVDQMLSTFRAAGS